MIGKKKRQEIGKMKVKKLMRYILRVQIGDEEGKGNTVPKVSSKTHKR